MSGVRHLPIAPLLTPEQAGRVLDEVLYERVLALVDLHGLYNLEQELWSDLGSIEDIDDDAIPEMAKTMIDRALARIPAEPRRYMSFHGTAPFGDDCELCNSLEGGETRRVAKPPPRRHGAS